MNGEEDGAAKVGCDQAAFRMIIGLLGMLLPLVLALGGWFFYDRGGFFQALATSISAYYHFGEAAVGYHPAMRDVFVGVLFLIGLSLIYYRGYEKREEKMSDNLVANIAGFSAIAVALVPTKDELGMSDDITGVFHMVFAALFFLSLAWFCWAIFTRTGTSEMTAGKRKRNRIYKLCAKIILVAMVLIGLMHLPFFEEFEKAYKPIFWLEAFAVITFGISWRIKANTTFRALFLAN